MAGMLGPALTAHGSGEAAALLLAGGALLLLLLAENSRVPVDDPTTHLELTMIHEVMVLDHAGPDLAFILYGAMLKLWLFAALLVDLALPVGGLPALPGALLFLAGMALSALLVALVESSMARLRLARVPQLLIAASVLAAFSLLLSAS